jgi:cell division septation protein DedD
MEESLKARLIGAAVLVALAVLLIPEMLSGRKAVEPVAEEGTGPRGTRTFTIELGQGPGQATRSQPSSTAAAPAPAAVASTEVPAEAKAAADVPVEPQVEPTTETPPPAQTEAAAAAATPAKVVQEPKAASTTAETAPAATHAEPKPPPALTAGGGWAVQVGAFSAAETARKLVKDLGGAGYRAFVSPVSKGGKTLYRVRVGPEGDKAGAEQLAQRLKARGLPATVVQND